MQGIDVLCGLALDGGSLGPRDDLQPGQSLVGHMVRGPVGLLADLELRLGIATRPLSHGVRVARYGARLARLAPQGRFYSDSHAVDAWGTAEALLRLRDELVDAGWNGQPIPGGGERLTALAELESLEDAASIAGTPDRLRAVAEALTEKQPPLYGRLQLADPRALFSARWQAIFVGLEQHGTRVEPYEARHSLAPETTDLGRLQRHILDGGAAPEPKGDGTLWLLRAETVWEAAHATAALLAAWNSQDQRIAVIRSGDEAPLDQALSAAGLSTQGVSSPHRLRPILQVASLALELAFEPKDPRRVLELLALPDGPFRGHEQRYFSDAIAEMPGLGNEAWEEAKQKLAARLRELVAEGKYEPRDGDVEKDLQRRLDRVAAWIETPGVPEQAAPRARLLEVVARVQKWLQGRLAWLKDEHGAEEEPSLEQARVGMALSHASALADALAAESRAALTLVQVRQLVEATLGQGAVVDLHPEQAGRIDHVHAPAAMLVPRDTVVWWGCTADAAEPAPRAAFQKAELEALTRAGIQLLDRRAMVKHQAEGWRRAILSASTRLVLVAPRFVVEEEAAPHPIWDEICARLGGERTTIARVCVEAADLRHGKVPHAPALSLETLTEARLPEARPEWKIDFHTTARTERMSATAIESFVGCPLRFVLDYKAHLRDGSLVALPDAPRLNGNLGHRLVEKLHGEQAFKLGKDALRARAEAVFDALLPMEAAPLLLPGQRAELSQVRQQLARAVVHLGELLRRSKLELVAVEKEEKAIWREAELTGRLDVLLVDADGNDVVLDLKWGRASYSEKLATGTATQLAVYGWLRKQGGGKKRFPAVAYFSLSRGTALATDDDTFQGIQPIPGIDADETWQRLEHTVELVTQTLTRGRVPVPGVARGVPTPAACGASPSDPKHLPLAKDAACGYCSHDVVCGKRWEDRP